MRVGEFCRFFQFATRLSQEFGSFLGVPAQVVMVIGTSRFCLLIGLDDVLLRRCEMRVSPGVDILNRPLRDRYPAKTNNAIKARPDSRFFFIRHFLS